MSDAPTPNDNDIVDPAAPPADPAAPPADPAAPPSPWFQSEGALPDDWREQLAGGDDKRLNDLRRVPDFGTFTKRYFDAQETIRKGLKPSGPPEDEAALTEWRKENGIPEAPDKYELKLEEGLTLSDADRESLQPLFEIMHQDNIKGETANKLINSYFKMQSLERDHAYQQDQLDAGDAEKTMRRQWGNDFEANQNLIATVLQAELGQEMFELFEGARLANGKALFNEPAVLQAFANIARAVNPVAALVPGGNNPMQTLQDELKSLQSEIGSDSWYKDKGKQERFLEIQRTLDMMNSRQRAG